MSGREGVTTMVDNETYEDIFKYLDEVCHQCKGTGKAGWLHNQFFAGGMGLPDCDVCYGTGYQVTRAGVELLNFLRRQKKRIERERV